MPPPIFFLQPHLSRSGALGARNCTFFALLNGLCKREQRTLLAAAKVAFETARRSDIGRLPGLGRAVSLPSLSHLPDFLNAAPLTRQTWLATFYVVARSKIGAAHLDRFSSQKTRSWKRLCGATRSVDLKFVAVEGDKEMKRIRCFCQWTSLVKASGRRWLQLCQRAFRLVLTGRCDPARYSNRT